jgi:hypothetical protein
MIQRVQTIWLLLAVIIAFVLTTAPLYTGTMAGQVVKTFITKESLLLFAVTAITGLLALIAIFLFKNRKLQKRFTTFGILFSIALVGLEVWQISEFRQENSTLTGSYAWGALLPIALVFFFIMAASGIRKDEKLIKSLDRLR